MYAASMFSLLPLAAGLAPNCNVGLTVQGLGQLDGDWMADELDDEQAFGFQRKKDTKKGLDGAVLQLGCYFCDEADKKRVEHTWVVRTFDENGHARLLATCTEGCPDTKTWPLNWTTQHQWLIQATNETERATASCCKRKSQRCDACDEKKCRSHDSLTSCLAASTLGGCCTAAAWVDEGICKCQSSCGNAWCGARSLDCYTFPLLVALHCFLGFFPFLWAHGASIDLIGGIFKGTATLSKHSGRNPTSVVPVG